MNTNVGLSHNKDGIIVGIYKFTEESGIENNQYDIIIMDLMMPKLDGLSASRAIRALGVNNSADVPIIAATARDPITELAHWQAAGITDYVHKPFSEDELWAVINTYV